MKKQRIWDGIVGSILLLPLLFYGIPHGQRPARTNEVRSLFQGIDYQRQTISMPHPVVLHVLSINLAATGLRVLVTPADAVGHTATTAQPASAFMEQFKLQVAVNASFFSPFRENTPWDYYPRRGDRADVVGHAISNGKPYSSGQANWGVICFFTNQQAQILDQAECPKGTVQAVSGNQILVNQGKPVAIDPADSNSNKPYPRLAVAIDATGQRLWVVAVDGKQLRYSEGVTLSELADVLIKLGADAALNLDGGGSTTIVAETPTGAELLNAPIHAKIPMQERPIANVLGFYANPLVD